MEGPRAAHLGVDFFPALIECFPWYSKWPDLCLIFIENFSDDTATKSLIAQTTTHQGTIRSTIEHDPSDPVELVCIEPDAL
jgi:hypothetical protein